MALVEKKSAKVSLNLSKQIDFDNLRNVFLPLGLPNKVRAFQDYVALQLIQVLGANVDFALKPGKYELPLSFGEPCIVEIPSQCNARGRIRVGKNSEYDSDEPIIRKIDLDINPPLVFHNISQTLIELNKVFNDKNLSLYLEKILDLGLVKKGMSYTNSVKDIISSVLAQTSWISLLSKNLVHSAQDIFCKRLKLTPFIEPSMPWNLINKGLSFTTKRITSQVDTIFKIKLKRVEGRPYLVDDEWRLALYFSGSVQYFNTIPIPFFKIKLPGFILPILHASPKKLFTSNPLASAKFLSANMPSDHFVEAITKSIEKFNCGCKTMGKLPFLEIKTETIDKHLLAANIEHPEKFGLSARITGNNGNRRFEFKKDGIRLSLNGGKINVNGSGEVSPYEIINTFLKPDSKPLQLKNENKIVEKLASLAIKIGRGSTMEGLKGKFNVQHPLVKGYGFFPLSIDHLTLSGDYSTDLLSDKTVFSENGNINFSFGLKILSDAMVEDYFNRYVPSLDKAKFKGQVEWKGNQTLSLNLEGSTHISIDGATRINTLPELSIEEGDIKTKLKGKSELNVAAKIMGHKDGSFKIDIKGTRFRVESKNSYLTLGKRQLYFPFGMVFEGEVRRGELSSSGLGELEVDLKWDLHERSPVLKSEYDDIHLLVNELRRGAMTVILSSTGGMSIKGKKKGLFDAHFFNALINPQAEPGKLLEILKSDKTVKHVLSVLRVFSSDLAKILDRGYEEFKKHKKILEKEGISEPKHIIPRADMARIASLLLCGSEKLVEKLMPIIKQVTDGKGLNRVEVKKIVYELYPDHDFEFELDRGLRWLDHVLSPVDKILIPEAKEEPPLATDPTYTSFLSGLPSAGEIYAVLDKQQQMPRGFSQLVSRVAPYLTLEQITTITDNADEDWKKRDLSRLNYIKEIKKRMKMVAGGYGGVGYIFQAMAISFYLGDVINTSLKYDEWTEDETNSRSIRVCTWDCVLGPEDVAVLLQAGLTLPYCISMVQINQRLLLDYIAARPDSFLHEVLIEMGENSPRILAGLLIGLLDQDQGYMKDPINIVEMFSKRLGIQIPIREDYMAGGRWARSSYYEAILRVAEYVIDNSKPYLAQKNYLQVQQHPISGYFKVTPKSKKLIDKAKKIIAKADNLGKQFIYSDNGKKGSKTKAVKAYQNAFQVCAQLYEANKDIIRIPWFKKFWQRNYEALVVLSVVRNYQQNIDNVRQWLHVRSGQSNFESEQNLLETVIDVLYHFTRDQKILKNDPLVRLLIDPPSGKYDFTIISCMGIITEGVKGTELEEAFTRMEKIRGVKTIRADTKTMETLENNAKKVEEAIRSVKTPWGYVGYSQGSPNGLKTESMLRGGTPEQQKLLEGFRCRHLLFGAHNGSAHGSGGNEKLRRAMIEGELFLKHYQGIYSSWAINACLTGIKQILDSRLFVHVIGGAESISHEGSIALARDGQFVANVPTTTVRGVVTQEIMPEALEFLSNVLNYQVDFEAHDTQVTLDSTVGYLNRVTNDNTRLLKRCDIGSYAQTSHHWSPLKKETEFLATKRDDKNAIYDMPKDRHIFPWIEVNARFGVIKRVNKK